MKQKSRRLRVESLEARRMMVAEGAPFNLSVPVNTAGLVGNASAVVDWGDGTTSAAALTGGNATGNVRIQFDYSLDSGRFFGTNNNDPFRRALQVAADALVSRFQDNLTAVGPVPFVTVRPRIFHPSQGPANSPSGNLFSLPENPTIPANTIIVFAGARDLPGAARGVGGGASISFSRTCIPGPQCDQAIANQNAVQGRGQPGALASPATDVAPLFGSISFDAPSRSEFYIGDDADVPSNQIDFISVATHELAHALGFATSESWNRLAASGSFAGQKARTAWVGGSGNVPLQPGHWANSVVDGQATLMGPSIDFGVRVPFSPLDFAAMDDIGWDVVSTTGTVTASHRFGDDGSFPTAVTLTGARGGELTFAGPTASVTNVAPTLTTVANRSVGVGQAFSITDIGTFTDPGFGSESFTFTIDWGDGTIDDGNATIDRAGNGSGQTTSGSFNGSHRYETPGNKTVTVRVVDDDGGAAQRNFTITVQPPPELTLSLSQPSVLENDLGNAARLTITRSGQALPTAQTITLTSSDTTEATLPPTAVIAAGAMSVEVAIASVDDLLLDGPQTVTLSASGSGVESGTVDLIVNDLEALSARFSSDAVAEAGSDGVTLRIARSNNDVDSPLNVAFSGPRRAELNLTSPIVIPAGQRVITIPVSATDDSIAELTELVELTFTSAGYRPDTASIEVIDNEPPAFQNPVDRFDATDDQEVTAFDALRIINLLARRAGENQLDPETETLDGLFADVSGDYQVTALDALQVINELARRRVTPPGAQAEWIAGVDDNFRFDELGPRWNLATELF